MSCLFCEELACFDVIVWLVRTAGVSVAPENFVLLIATSRKFLMTYETLPLVGEATEGLELRIVATPGFYDVSKPSLAGIKNDLLSLVDFPAPSTSTEFGKFAISEA